MIHEAPPVPKATIIDIQPVHKNKDGFPEFKLTVGSPSREVLLILKSDVEMSKNTTVTADYDSNNEYRLYAPESTLRTLQAIQKAQKSLQATLDIGPNGPNAFFYNFTCSGFPANATEVKTHGEIKGQVDSFYYQLSNATAPSFSYFAISYIANAGFPTTSLELCTTPQGIDFQQSYYDGNYNFVLPSSMTDSVYDMLSSCKTIPTYIGVDSKEKPTTMSLQKYLPAPSNAVISITSSAHESPKSAH